MEMAETNETNLCYYQPPDYLDERFWLVTVFGSLVSVISCCENAFLFSILLQKKQHRNSHCLYLLLLAFFDFFIAFAYVLLMSVSVLADYLESPTLLNAWYHYMVPMITISHVALTASSFLILSASFERFCITCWTARIRMVNRYRRFIAAFAIFFGLLTKITLIGEFDIAHRDECVGTMAEWELRPSEMVMGYYYNLFWRLGFRNLFTIWVPFFFLLFMNGQIIRVLRREHTNQNTEIQHLEKLSEVQRKRRIRAATRTLLLIAFTYLLANVVNVVLTIWEYFDINSLTGQFIAFYTFGVDAVSILTVITGALRPFIYLACMPPIRKDILFHLRKITGRNKYKVDNLKEGETVQYASMLMRISEMLMRYPRPSMDSTLTGSDETEESHSAEVFL